jgi:pimeloyl-ACP methyl ester carboxylesterase/DNA-binding winged helix-turn-helix (wHTH) protein
MRHRFGRYVLDTARFELLKDGAPLAVEPQVLDLLRYLVEHHDRLVTRDELFDTIWTGKTVSEAALSSRIKAARGVIEDSGPRQEWIKTVHGRGFRFIGPVTTEPDPEIAAAISTDKRESPLSQDIRYCRTPDNIRIAYATTGRGPTIVKAANWMSHLEFDLESPIWRHWIYELSRRHQLVRYDERGNGLSDRDISDLSFEAMVSDLESVVDAVGVDRFVLFGISQGCAVSVEYAIRHPERVSQLILYGGFVKGWRLAGSPVEVGQRIAMSSLIRTGWGLDNPAFRQLFTSRFMPGASQEQMAWFNELQRQTVSPALAGDLHDIFGTIDVEHRLAAVTTPTLVLHARNDGEIPLESGRAFATGIPGARFVTLESPNHIMLAEEPAFARFIEEVGRFIAEDQTL